MQHTHRFSCPYLDCEFATDDPDEYDQHLEYEDDLEWSLHFDPEAEVVDYEGEEG